MQHAGKFITDTILSFLSLAVMNIVLQFVIYPYFEKHYGMSTYGDIIYLMALISIASAAIGSGVNLARMKSSVVSQTCNSDFLVYLLLLFLIAVPFCIIYWHLGNYRFSVGNIALYVFLLLVTSLRNYADVEYRLNINYKKYFIYYVCISIGYLIGIIIGKYLHLWYLTFITGEICALTYCACTGSILTNNILHPSPNLKRYFIPTVTLVLSLLISNFILNADKIVIKYFMGSSSVAVYYIASLFGKTMSLISLPLNNVLVGYLAKSKRQLTKKDLRVLSGSILFVCVLCLAACSLCSHIILPLLYPDSSKIAEPYYELANAPSALFFGTSFLTIFLLRYSPERCQLYANIIYAASFIIFCIPGCYLGGIVGLCGTLLLANTIRFISVFVMCAHYLEDDT